MPPARDAAAVYAMLYLSRLPDDADPEREQLPPVADLTAAALERALLATDAASAQRELSAALVADPALIAWAVGAAKQRAVSPTTISEAATFFSQTLVQHLKEAVRLAPSSNTVERVPAEEASRHALAYAAAFIEARASAPTDGESKTVSDLAHSTDYFANLVAAVERLRIDELPLGLSELTDPLAYYFLAEQPGIEWRLPALVAKLANYEAQLADFDRRLEHEKLKSLKELAYGASHEINNPLANIAARAQTLLQGENDSERRRKLTAIHRQAMRAHEMIADLMLFARPPKLEAARCDVRQIVERIVGEMGDEAAEREIQLATHLPAEALEISADPTQIAVAIKALVTNALEAIGAGGQIDVSVEPTDSGEERVAQITVVDDGPGISEAVRGHMFDPFFSGREAGRGLGFGLSKCWRIVTDHGGQVVVHKPRGRGAEISILLPLTRGRESFATVD